MPAGVTVGMPLRGATADNESAENRSEGSTENRNVDGMKTKWIYS